MVKNTYFSENDGRNAWIFILIMRSFLTANSPSLFTPFQLYYIRIALIKYLLSALAIPHPVCLPFKFVVVSKACSCKFNCQLIRIVLLHASNELRYKAMLTTFGCEILRTKFSMSITSDWSHPSSEGQFQDLFGRRVQDLFERDREKKLEEA